MINHLGKKGVLLVTSEFKNIPVKNITVLFVGNVLKEHTTLEAIKQATIRKQEAKSSTIRNIYQKISRTRKKGQNSSNNINVIYATKSSKAVTI